MSFSFFLPNTNHLMVGEKIHSYEDLPFKGPVTCVEYHPFQDILAMCGLGGRTVSVCLFRHSDQLHAQKEDNDSFLSSNNEMLLPVPQAQSSRNPLNKSKTVDHSNDTRPQNVLKKTIRRAEVAIRMKSLD